MIYLRQPNLEKALAEIDSLIAEEPANPYFYEVRGQIYMSMAKPALAIPDYQKSVALRPNAPQLHVALATARWPPKCRRWRRRRCRISRPPMAENDDPTWYETAQAYSLLDNEPMANLATAEQWYNLGDMRKAVVFASRARGKLPQGAARLGARAGHHRCCRAHGDAAARQRG